MTNSPIYRSRTFSQKPKHEYAAGFTHWEALIRGGIARQQRFVFLKRYPHFAPLQYEHPTRSNLQYITKALH